MKHIKKFEYILSSTDTKHIKSDRDLSDEEVIEAKYLDAVSQLKIDNNIKNFNDLLTKLRTEYPNYDGYTRKIALAVWMDNWDDVKKI